MFSPWYPLKLEMGWLLLLPPSSPGSCCNLCSRNSQSGSGRALGKISSEALQRAARSQPRPQGRGKAGAPSPQVGAAPESWRTLKVCITLRKISFAWIQPGELPKRSSCFAHSNRCMQAQEEGHVSTKPRRKGCLPQKSWRGLPAPKACLPRSQRGGLSTQQGVGRAWLAPAAAPSPSSCVQGLHYPPHTLQVQSQWRGTLSKASA